MSPLFSHKEPTNTKSRAKTYFMHMILHDYAAHMEILICRTESRKPYSRVLVDELVQAPSVVGADLGSAVFYQTIAIMSGNKRMEVGF